MFNNDCAYGQDKQIFINICQIIKWRLVFTFIYLYKYCVNVHFVEIAAIGNEI